MDKEKIKFCLILTFIGVILIIVLQTIISMDDEREEKEYNYIKVNAINAATKCVNDGKCTEDEVSFRTLIELEYLDSYFEQELKGYSLESKVKIPNYEIELIKNSTK